MNRKPPATRDARARQKARADRAHERYVQRVYGLEPGQYQQMLEAQDGRCAICTRRPRNRRLAVDHDHNTGKVRALLCYTCNHFALRYLEGDPIACHNAAVYFALLARDYGPEYEPWLAASPSTNTNGKSSATPPIVLAKNALS